MFRTIIFRLGLRYISRRLFQSILFILGVALGVAVVIAIDLANGSASRAFELSSQTVTGRATHQIVGSSNGLPTTLYTQLRRAGVRLSAPIISEFVQVEGLPKSLRLLGVDPFAEPPFRDYLTQIEVIGADDINAVEALTRFVTEPNTVLLSQSLADDAGVSAGDTLTLIVGTRRIEVTIIGVLLPSDSLSQQALDNLLLTDIATAQELADMAGRITRIDLILSDELVPLARDILPTGAILVDASSSGGALAQMTDAFELNLQALSLLAVVVGVFLIYNTVTFSVVQRRPVIGILRSLGAAKRQVFAFIIGEAFVLGIIGTILGVALGIIFGRFTVALVSQTISDLYFALDVSTVAATPASLAKGLGLGLLASVGAALIPSIDASRTLPVGSMQRSTLEEKTAELVPYISVGAVGFLIMGYLLLQVSSTSLFLSFAALFCIIFGGALLTPLALILALRLLLPVVERIFGVVGRLANRTIVRSLSRTSVAVAALTIAVSVIIGVSVMISSFRNTVANWLEITLSADIYVSPPGFNANQATIDVDPLLRDAIAAVEGIDVVNTTRNVAVIAPDYPDLPPVNLNAIESDYARDARGFVWQTDGYLDDGQIMVSEPFAFRRGITQENNRITLLTDNGEREFTVFGVFYDYTTDQGLVFISRETYNQYWNDPYITAVAAFVAPDADIEAVVERIESEVLPNYAVEIQSNRTLRENVFEVFERTFTITIALRLLATLVAFIGILSALMSLQLEHAREFGVMRATGMTPNQLRGFTFVQTGLMGLIAGVLAMPIGVTLAVVLVYVINVRSFGWTMQFGVQPNELLLAFMVALVAALLAGIYPAYRLARMNVSMAIRSE